MMDVKKTKRIMCKFVSVTCLRYNGVYFCNKVAEKSNAIFIGLCKCVGMTWLSILLINHSG